MPKNPKHPRLRGLRRAPLLRQVPPAASSLHLIDSLIQSHNALVALVAQLSQPRFEHASIPGYHHGRGGVWTKNKKRNRRKRNKKKTDAPQGARVPSSPPPSSPPQPGPSPTPSSNLQAGPTRSFSQTPRSPRIPSPEHDPSVSHLHGCLRCKRHDVLCDEASLFSICKECKLKGPVSPNCPDPSCSAIGTMSPTFDGDKCSKCDCSFPVCLHCSSFYLPIRSPSLCACVLDPEDAYRRQNSFCVDMSDPNWRSQIPTTLPHREVVGQKLPASSSSSSSSSSSTTRTHLPNREEVGLKRPVPIPPDAGTPSKKFHDSKETVSSAPPKVIFSEHFQGNFVVENLGPDDPLPWHKVPYEAWDSQTSTSVS